MKTKQEKLNELIEKLGMQVDMQPLLDSDANGKTGYERFEKAVENVLDSYRGKRPRIKKTVYGYKRPGTNPVSVLDRDFSRSNWYEKSHYVPLKLEACKSFKSFERCGDYFRRNYGIGCEAETMQDIAKSEGISYGNVVNRVRVVLNIIKQKHKKDLWYGSL